MLMLSIQVSHGIIVLKVIAEIVRILMFAIYLSRLAF